MWAEARPALHQDKNGVKADRKDGAVWVGPILEGEKVLKALGTDGATEAERRNADTDPRELVRDTDDAIEVSFFS